jgi:hypothetical protein
MLVKLNIIGKGASMKQAKITVQKELKFGKNDRDAQRVVKSGKIVDTDGTVVIVGNELKCSQNYQSVGITCGVHYPTTKAKIDQAFEEAWSICGDQMAAQMKEAQTLLRKIS